MGFDVNVAARQLGVDPSKITASADGSTYTVTANGVTKTYKASGEGDNSVFTPEQTTSASGSGTSGSSGTQGSITVDQSIWSQNLSALQSNLQADLFMNSGLMSGIPNMPDSSGNLFQIIQNLMNSINVQMPTMPTVQPVIPPVVVDGSGSAGGTDGSGSAGGTGGSGGAGSTKAQKIKDLKLVEGKGKNAALKGIYYVDKDGNGKISDGEASGKCYVWDEDEQDFIVYKKHWGGMSYVREGGSPGERYELVTSTDESGEIMSGSFRKKSVRRVDSATAQKYRSEARQIADKFIAGIEYTMMWGTVDGTDKDRIGEASGSDGYSSDGPKVTKDNIMYVLEEFEKARRADGKTEQKHINLFHAIDDETDAFDASDDWFFKSITEKLCAHAEDVADQTGNEELRTLARKVKNDAPSLYDDTKKATALTNLYNKIKEVEGPLP